MNKGVVPRYRDAAEKLNAELDQTSRLASQAIGGLTKVQPAAEIMESLMEELVDALQTDHLAIKATAEVVANATSGKL